MNISRASLPLLADLAFCLLAPARTADVIPNSDCLDCHGQNDLVKTNASGQAISLYVDPARLAASTHRTNLCANCHSDLTRQHPDDGIAAKTVNCATCHPRQSQSYGVSAHAIAIKQGDAGAATCRDCHGHHDISPPNSPTSRLHFSKLATTCGECHPEAARDLQVSVHGTAAARGEREAATCTDCHSEHRIQALKDSSSRHVSQDVCAKCHASERINTKFSLPSDRVRTFFESYHGLAAQYGGGARAANCASCHGAHRILPSTDARSSIHKDHLVETCGKCHPGATRNFALSRIHVGDSSDDTGSIVNRWVRRIYLALIFATIGGMVLHNGLVWFRKALAARQSPDRSVTRMSPAQRRQHFILLASFILLALSGFALKYPDSWLAWCLGGNETIRRWLHRGAGVLLLLVGAYHILYVATRAEGRRLVRDLLPTWNDLRDTVTQLRFLATGRGPRPIIGRFGYAEKMEYWAVVWGTLIMGVTGLMIWLKIDVTLLLPRWAVEVANTIHYYEAILATLAIVVWHFYHVVFDPDVYPMNWAWLDGKVSKHWHAEKHPLDTEARPTPPTAQAHPTTQSSAKSSVTTPS
jgi:formate dehydrogenase gamma subunit